MVKSHERELDELQRLLRRLQRTEGNGSAAPAGSEAGSPTDKDLGAGSAGGERLRPRVGEDGLSTLRSRGDERLPVPNEAGGRAIITTSQAAGAISLREPDPADRPIGFGRFTIVVSIATLISTTACVLLIWQIMSWSRPAPGPDRAAAPAADRFNTPSTAAQSASPQAPPDTPAAKGAAPPGDGQTQMAAPAPLPTPAPERAAGGPAAGAAPAPPLIASNAGLVTDKPQVQQPPDADLPPEALPPLSLPDALPALDLAAASAPAPDLPAADSPVVGPKEGPAAADQGPEPTDVAILAPPEPQRPAGDAGPQGTAAPSPSAVGSASATDAQPTAAAELPIELPEPLPAVVPAWLSAPAQWVARPGGVTALPIELDPASRAAGYQVMISGLEPDATISGGVEIIAGTWLIEAPRLAAARLERGVSAGRRVTLDVSLRTRDGLLVARDRYDVLTSDE